MTVYAGLDELANVLTQCGAESTQAQVATHCLRHGSKQAAISLGERGTATMAPHTDEHGTCIIVTIEPKGKIKCPI